jgi:hypothetical protein
VLRPGADIVVMVHPGYQYTPRLVTAMVSMNVSGHYDVVLESRILGGEAWRDAAYFVNRFLTFVENLFLGVNLSYHTGYRAFTYEVLTTLSA